MRTISNLMEICDESEWKWNMSWQCRNNITKIVRLGKNMGSGKKFSDLLFSHCHVWLFATPWTASHQAFLSFTISWSLLRLMSIESVMPSNHLILCYPLLLLPSFSLSPRIRARRQSITYKGVCLINGNICTFLSIINTKKDYDPLLIVRT